MIKREWLTKSEIQTLQSAVFAYQSQLRHALVNARAGADMGDAEWREFECDRLLDQLDG